MRMIKVMLLIILYTIELLFFILKYNNYIMYKLVSLYSTDISWCCDIYKLETEIKECTQVLVKDKNL